MSFNIYKQQTTRSSVTKPHQQEMDRMPRQFSDYMCEQSTRFTEICSLYLEGMTVDDIQHMKPKDLIKLVPPEQYKHRLLMTVMVRRYLYSDDTESLSGSDSDTYEPHDNPNTSNVTSNITSTHKNQPNIKPVIKSTTKSSKHANGTCDKCNKRTCDKRTCDKRTCDKRNKCDKRTCDKCTFIAQNEQNVRFRV
jgi:hypothetical protein